MPRGHNFAINTALEDLTWKQVCQPDNAYVRLFGNHPHPSYAITQNINDFWTSCKMCAWDFKNKHSHTCTYINKAIKRIARHGDVPFVAFQIGGEVFSHAMESCATVVSNLLGQSASFLLWQCRARDWVSRRRATGWQLLHIDKWLVRKTLHLRRV